MADDVDVANDLLEKVLQARIEEAQYQLGHAVSANEDGTCLNCGEPLKVGYRWCDLDCQKDFTARRNAQARRGRFAE